METIIINDNPFSQNIYIYFDKETREGVIIDPGDSFEKARDEIEKNNLKIVGILLTHGHYDHTFRVNKIRELTNAPVYAHKNETELLQNAEFNRSSLHGFDVSVKPDKFFSDVFEFSNGKKLKIIHTPGHTSGGVCFYDEENAVIFTGDTLFRGTIGRTDMPTGDYDTLIKSIKENLFTLPGNVVVFPGHEESSTIEYEINNNRIVGATK